MKVGVFLIGNVNPSLGGNFSYYDKLIHAIDSHEFRQPLEICFVGRKPSENIKTRKAYVRIAPPFIYTFFNILNKLRITSFLSRIFSFNADLCARLDSRRLRKKGVDVLLFPNQFVRGVNDFPFITMNWDAGHKTTYAFPELLENFEARDHWYRIEIQKALAILVESESSKQEFSNYYAIPPHKIEVIPLFAGGVIDMNVPGEVQKEILSKFNLGARSFFYYPAQFWAHKNHYNLILGFKKFLSRRPDKNIKLVFSGSDMGNKEYILSTIAENQLTENVIVLGFISREEVYTLYRNSIALTMATFLGPTNMPLLEAQSLETPIICSDLNGHRETCGSGALYVEPADADKWADALQAVLDDATRKSLLQAASQFKATSPFNIIDAIARLEAALIRLRPIRKTFY